RAGRNDRFEQLLLPAEQAEVAAVPRLAGRRVIRQPGSLAEDRDRDVGPACGGDRLGHLLVGPVAQAGATGVDDPLVTETVPEPIEDRRHPRELIGYRIDDITRRKGERVRLMT